MRNVYCCAYECCETVYELKPGTAATAHAYQIKNRIFYWINVLVAHEWSGLLILLDNLIYDLQYTVSYETIFRILQLWNKC